MLDLCVPPLFSKTNTSTTYFLIMALCGLHSLFKMKFELGIEVHAMPVPGSSKTEAGVLLESRSLRAAWVT